ncbi:MAG: hypothetical protein DMG83_12280 [Acidobacteria bacterium]|nr:MAG: hypothetical protein DMG83_12280 [Acidobacteriota bacterium]
MVPIGSFSEKLIEHRKRAQHLESIELADESEGADRYNKCTWVITAEVRPAGPRQDRERISLNFEMASINLRQSAFSATLGPCDLSASAPVGSTAKLLLMGLAACAIAQLRKNDLSVRGRREKLSMAIAHFLGFHDRVKRKGLDTHPLSNASCGNITFSS